MKVADAEMQERRQKRIIIILFSLGVLGLSFVVYDYLRIVNRASFQEDLAQVDPVVARWKADGLVQSFDPELATLVVDENRWRKQAKEAKAGIITQLARYCAKKKNSNTWSLKVLGGGSFETLGELGPSGLRIQ